MNAIKKFRSELNKVQNLLKAARQDINFVRAVKAHEPEEYRTINNTDPLCELWTCAAYMGYLIGKGTYNEKDYEKNTNTLLRPLSTRGCK